MKCPVCGFTFQNKSPHRRAEWLVEHLLRRHPKVLHQVMLISSYQETQYVGYECPCGHQTATASMPYHILDVMKDGGLEGLRVHLASGAVRRSVLA